MNAWQRVLGWRLGKRALIVALLALSLTGCANQNPYMYTGAGLGGALGAGLGAAINHSNPWRGAAIGGLLGAAAGGVAGEAYGRSNPYPPYQSQQQGYYYQQPQPQPQPQPYYNPPPG